MQVAEKTMLRIQDIRVKAVFKSSRMLEKRKQPLVRETVFY